MSINNQVESQRLVLIDASGFIFRAYHKLPPLTRGDGTPVGAVFGYVNIMTKLLEETHASHIAAIFDAERRNFRHDIYPEYKANRPPAPEDLIPQFALVRQATEAMNLSVVELSGYEADDVIATYARQAHAVGMEVIIVSSDKDLMQLIQPGIHMYDAMKGKALGAAEVMEKFGVTPDKVIDVQSLIGDASDHVPGVPGIGPKTAAELIQQFGSLDVLLERASEIPQPKRRESLLKFADQARLSKQLVTLDTQCPNLPALDTLLRRDMHQETFVRFLQEQNFTSLVTRFNKRFGLKDAVAQMSAGQPSLTHAAQADSSTLATTPPKASPPTRYELVRDAQALTAWIALAKKHGRVAFDTETDSLDATRANLVGFSLCVEAGHACYVPLNHQSAQESGHQNDLFAPPVARVAGQMEVAEALRLIAPLLMDESVIKIGQNIKYDALIMAQHNIRISPIDDTMLLSYCLSAGLHTQGMDELSRLHLGIQPVTFDEVTGTGKKRVSFNLVGLDDACRYAAEDADITLRLHEILKPRLISERLVSVYEDMERPLVPVITRMEAHGIKVDVSVLKNLSSEFSRDISILEADIFQMAGRSFTIGSPKQLGEVLFDEMKLAGGKQSKKSGAYATGAQILEDLVDQGHVFPAKILEWRQLTKLRSTYTEALVEQINPRTGRVHTNFSLAVTSTGRLSSSNPNLQNIPIRTTQGKRIRDAFVAEEGFKLLSADYSQIELRLLAHIADIAPLKQAFREGRDIHAATAAQMFGVPVNEVSSDLRRRAKTINFGIIYGISAHGLSVRLGITREEAARYIAIYFEQYPGIREYMERAKMEAREHGYVRTLFGRRCYIKGIHDKNGSIRQFSERAAINAPLQGTAADIIKRAMIAIDRQMQAQQVHSRMLLQVHDELVFEIAQEEEATLCPIIKRTMEQAAELSIPLVADVGIGEHWGEIH
ncbi:MAG: DNA polymerase I [Rickettsiales bacterium]|nr:DNA polymerase I [Rickettsiales bacterium]